MGDMELALAECRAAQSEGREISDAAARVVASMYNDGQGSRTYSLASTGNIGDRADGLCNLMFGYYGHLSADERLLYDMMGAYLRARVRDNRTGPVEGWSDLWLRDDRPRSSWGGMSGSGAEFF